MEYFRPESAEQTRDLKRYWMMKDLLMKFSYDYDEVTGILYKYYFGRISLDTIIKSWEIGIENGMIPAQRKGFIMDYRQANFDIPLKELNGLPEFYKKHPQVFEGYKLAFITNNPKDIVIPMVVQALDKTSETRPFSTTEAARIWILTGYF